jgi:hypothetical protein
MVQVLVAMRRIHLACYSHSTMLLSCSSACSLLRHEDTWTTRTAGRLPFAASTLSVSGQSSFIVHNEIFLPRRYIYQYFRRTAPRFDKRLNSQFHASTLKWPRRWRCANRSWASLVPHASSAAIDSTITSFTARAIFGPPAM